MSQRITITLPDEVAGPLGEIARARGQTLEEFACEHLARSVPQPHQVDSGSVNQAEQHFARWIGSLSLGRAVGSDNKTIDADLAREYAKTHENGD